MTDPANFFLYRNAWRFAGPPHKEPKLLPQQCNDLLKHGGLMVRNVYDFDFQTETCFWNVIKDQFGGFDELSGNTRRKVRRALEHCEYKIITADMLRQSGYAILKAAYDDYQVKDRTLSESVFQKSVDEFEQYNYEYWGVFDRATGSLVGFSANHVWDEACEYSLIGIRPECKRKSSAYPYYGLFYTMNQYYLQQKGLRYVTDGSRSITEHSNIQPFLEEKFHFRKAYCRLAVHYRWWMKAVVRVLYPFRGMITLPRVRAVLNMEAMRRGEK